MKIQGVLLGTIAEQIAGGDPNPIDPAKLYGLDENVRVSINFDSNRVVGRTTKLWRKDGRILFRADVDELKDFALRRPDGGPGKALAEKAAVAIVTSAELFYRLEMKDTAGYTIKGGKLMEVGLTDENENHNQPPFEVINDATV